MLVPRHKGGTWAQSNHTHHFLVENHLEATTTRILGGQLFGCKPYRSGDIPYTTGS